MVRAIVTFCQKPTFAVANLNVSLWSTAAETRSTYFETFLPIGAAIENVRLY